MTKSTTDLKKDLEVQERTVKLRELLEKKWKELPDNIGVGRFYIKLKPDDFEEAGFENIHTHTCHSKLKNPPNDCNCTGQLYQHQLHSQYEIYQCRSCGRYIGALANTELGYSFNDRQDYFRWKQQCFSCYKNFNKQTDDDIQKLYQKATEIETNLTAKIEDAIVILNKHTGSIDELNNAMKIVAQTEHACESEDEATTLHSSISNAHNRLDKVGENISAILDRLEVLEKKISKRYQ